MHKEQQGGQYGWSEERKFHSGLSSNVTLMGNSCLRILCKLAQNTNFPPSSSVTVYYLPCFIFLPNASHHQTYQIFTCLLIVHLFLFKCKLHESQDFAHFAHCYAPSTLQSVWHSKGDQIFIHERITMEVLKELKNRGYNLSDDILSLMIYPQYRSHAQ